MQTTHTVLEIGSGSFKLHRNDDFSLRFQSSLGKDMIGDALNPNSVKIALNSIENEILSFLESQNLKPNELIVFATAAVRRSMQDSAGSGQEFINKLNELGFKEVKIFSEEDECRYAALAVIEELGNDYDDFHVLDTGGASHQLIQIENREITKMQSFPIGSHTDLNQTSLPDFGDYQKEFPLVLLGTSGMILHHVEHLDLLFLEDMIKDMNSMTVGQRREYLSVIIQDEEVQELFVDYRLKVLPKAFSIIKNCAEKTQATEFLAASMQAMDYVSKYGL